MINPMMKNRPGCDNINPGSFLLLAIRIAEKAQKTSKKKAAASIVPPFLGSCCCT